MMRQVIPRGEPRPCYDGGSTMNSFRIAVIAGDGVGQEVTPAAQRVAEAAASKDGATLHWTPLDWGSDFYHRHGRMMPAGALGNDGNSSGPGLVGTGVWR